MIVICAGATACIECLQGTFASSNGSTECLSCPLGSFSVVAAAINCSSCWSEASGACKSVTANTCVPCNSLRFRPDPSRTLGNYLCSYGKLAPEFKCTIPDPRIMQKVMCDYEDSLVCTSPKHLRESNTIHLDCQPSKS